MGDYISRGLRSVMPDDAFPNMIVGTTSMSQWPFLRREIGHNWYVDKRNHTVGFVSRDEAAILYNTALAFQRLPCLEIGCWRGWSTVHLALGSGNLEVIDPVLRDSAFLDDVTETFRRAGVLEHLVLHDGFSPEEIERISMSTGKRWSLAFINGDHEGDAPVRDAEMVARFAAEDAVILLHDLASPQPAAALEALRSRGWDTWIYQTMQIMGVAVRGAIRPIEHIPDPSQSWTLPAHLAQFPVIGERRSAQLIRVTGFSSGRCSPAQSSDPTVLDDLPEEVALIVDGLLAEIGDLGYRVKAGCQDAEAASAFEVLQRKHLNLIEKLAEAERARNEVADERAAFDLLQQKHADQTENLARLQLQRDELARRGERLAAELAEVSRERDELRRGLAHSIGRIADLERAGAGLQRRHAELLQTAGSSPLLPSPSVVHFDEQAILSFSLWMASKRVLFGLGRRVVAGRKAEVRSLVERSLRDHGLHDGATATVIEWLSAPRVILGLGRRRLLAGMHATSELVVLEMRQRTEVYRLARSSASPEAARSQDPEQRFQALEKRFRALEAAKLEDEKALLVAQIAYAKLLYRSRRPTMTTAGGAEC